MKEILINEKLDRAYETSVNIAFAVDNNYLYKLNVTLLSVFDNMSNITNYDIVIMHTDISIDDQIKFLNSFPHRKNVTVRFLNIEEKLNEINLEDLYIEIQVTLSTYFRFLIQEIFSEYERVIYLDCDLIVLDDLKKLFTFDTEGRCLAAALDIREALACDLGLEVSNHGLWKEYVQKTLGMENEQQYFQAGVLLIDLSNMGNIDFKATCLKHLKIIKTPILSDQDVLNSAFYMQVANIPLRWNIEWQVPFEFPNYKGILPKQRATMYKQAINNPAIIHYASPLKPWKYPNLKHSELWWKYAKKSIYYDELLKCVEDDSSVRKDIMIKTLFPIKSKRRAIVKHFYSPFKRVLKLLRR